MGEDWVWNCGTLANKRPVCTFRRVCVIAAESGQVVSGPTGFRENGWGRRASRREIRGRVDERCVPEVLLVVGLTWLTTHGDQDGHRGPPADGDKPALGGLSRCLVLRAGEQASVSLPRRALRKAGEAAGKGYGGSRRTERARAPGCRRGWLCQQKRGGCGGRSSSSADKITMTMTTTTTATATATETSLV